MLRTLRHQVWAPPAPTGYKDGVAEWADPDSLMKRAEASRSLASELSNGEQPDPRDMIQVIALGANDPLRDMLADDSLESVERLALCLASPAFQWR